MKTIHTVIPAQAGIQRENRSAKRTMFWFCPADETISHSTDGTPSHSTRLSKNDNQVAGYKLAKNASKVAGYTRGLFNQLDSRLRGNDGVLA